jgi:hypothetical protein
MLTKSESLGYTSLVLLVGIIKMLQAEFLSIPEEPEEFPGMVAAAYDHDILDTSIDERAQRIIDHRCVIHWQQVLVGNFREWS